MTEAHEKRRLYEFLIKSAGYVLEDRATWDDILSRLTEFKQSCASGSALTNTLAACLIAASELASMSIPRRRRLLCKWLCEADLGYVFAAQGVGKTWLAMALPCAMSQGTALGLWEAGEEKVGVLYVDGEMPLELTQYRSKGMDIGAGDVTGGVIKHTSPKRILSYKADLPQNRKLIEDFEAFAAPLFAQINILVESNEKLRTARDLLLPRLMSGEIAV